MNELHLFAGAGGGILAGQLLGHRTVYAVEWEPYAQAVLVARQNDGTFPPFPVWDDVQTFDGRPWRGTDDRLDYTIEREGFSPGQKTPPKRLNPDWVEWLMGWPIGQTALKPLETGKYREWLQQHGGC
jgi:hypothetical protein